MLNIQNVTVDFPDGTGTVRALDHATLRAEKGQLLAITGVSGSGKSTLLSVAAGLIEPTEGHVELDGVDLYAGSKAERSQLRLEKIGLIFQQANLLGSLNARDQLLVMDHMRGRTPRRDRAEELLSFVGLAGMGDRHTGQLSGGQCQRVNIARALMGAPTLLLADEPTSALDSTLSAEIMELLRSVTEEFGTATAVVTHDLEQLSYADAVAEVADGKVHMKELHAME